MQLTDRETTRTRNLLHTLGVIVSFASLGACASTPRATAPTEEARSRAWPAFVPVASAQPQGTPLSPEVRDLSFGFLAPATNAAEERAVRVLQTALARRGFRLVAEDDPRQDARVVIAFTRISSLRADAAGDLQASVTLEHGSDVMSWLIAKVPANDLEADRESDDLAERLSQAPNLHTLARARAQRKSTDQLASSAEKPRPSAVAPSPTEGTLSEAALRRCRNARTLEECSKVRSYMERFPEGDAAMKARAALDLASARFDRQKSSAMGETAAAAATDAEPEDELPIGAP